MAENGGLKGIAQGFKTLQKNQPALGAELRAMFRQGREDLLATIFGPLVGMSREMGAPGTPTPQQVTEGLEQKEVDHHSDRIKSDKVMSLDDLRGYAKERSKEAEQRMDGHQRENGLER